MAQITSMACIWYQGVQWVCHLPSSDKTKETVRHLYPNLTLVLTWQDLHDRRSVGEGSTCYFTFILWHPSHIYLVNQWVYTYMKCISSFLWGTVCCYLLFLAQRFEMVYWPHLQVSGVQKTKSTTVIGSLIKPDTEPCLGISMRFRIA